MRGYPALVDEGTSVALRIEATPEAAASATRAGARRLLLLAVPSPAPYVLEHLTAGEKLALAALAVFLRKALIEDCRVAVADAVIARTARTGVIRTRAEFDTVRDALSAAVIDEVFAAVSLTARILTTAREVERTLRAQNSLTLLGALEDVKGQVAGLVYPGFVGTHGARTPRRTCRATSGCDRAARGSRRQSRSRPAADDGVRAARAASREAGGTLPPSQPTLHRRISSTRAGCSRSTG